MDKKEQMKVINHGIHDLVGATCNIGGWISVIQEELKNNKLNLEDLPRRLEVMSKSLKRINEVGDYLYIKFKEQ